MVLACFVSRNNPQLGTPPQLESRAVETVKQLRELRVKFRGVGGVELFTEAAINEAVSLIDNTYPDEGKDARFWLPRGGGGAAAAAAAAASGPRSVGEHMKAFSALRPTNGEVADKMQKIGLAGPPRFHKAEIRVNPGTIAASLEALSQCLEPKVEEYAITFKGKCE